MLVDLKQHLRRDHDITYDPLLSLERRLDISKTVNPRTLRMRKKWLDCATCSLSDAPES